MCHEEKPEEAFAYRSLATGERQSHCRVCHAAYRRQHYRQNKATYIENERVRVRKHRERNRQLILRYLLEHPCVDCGETDPIVLDFDHRDRATKRLEVSRLANHKTWPQVLAEIKKCDVRCASCHRRRTAAQFGWRRASLSDLSGAASLARTVAASVRSVVAGTSDLRICSSCGTAQPFQEFAMKNRRTGLRSTKCKTCQRLYSKAHYQRNREKYLARAKARNERSRDRFAAFLLAYLREHPCVDCRETDPTVLEFDHRDGVDKIATVNELARDQRWTALEAEIAKCDVRCANCHRRRTAQQFGWISRIGEDGVAA